MLNLVLTTDKLSLISSSGEDLDVHASWADAPNPITPTSDITAGKTNTAITTATTTDIVPAPASSTVRNVKFIAVRNIGAAVNDVTVQFNANATLYTLMKVSLLAGEELKFDEGTWFHYDSN